MKIKLSGGQMDGTETEVSDGLDVVSFPSISLRDNKAVIVSDDEVKRHSWDDDALNISYLDYYRTDIEADDGTVIFVSKEAALHYQKEKSRMDIDLNAREDALLKRMIQESGEMWREVRDRTAPNSEVIICETPGRAFYLIWTGNVEGNINGWRVQIQPLHMEDAREFFAAFGSHYHYWIGVIFRDGNPVRAYIKNGRKEDWTISVGPCA